MLEKRYKFKGLNLRNPSITRGDNYASAVKNVELNDRGELVKRFGYTGVTDSVSLIDLYEYKKGNELVGLFNDGAKRLESNAWVDIPFGNSTNPKAWTTFADDGEYNGVLYLTDPDLNNFLYKYDGDYFYKAGMQKAPAPDPVIAGGANYFRYFYKTIDAQKNQVNGDYYQFDSSSATPVVTVDTLADSEYKTRYAIEDAVQNDTDGKTGSYTNADGLLELAYLTGHNVLPDTWMMIRVQRTFDNVTEAPCVNVRVDSVDGDNITLDLSTLSDGDTMFAGIQPSFNSNLASMSINYYYSTDAEFGYFKTGEELIYQNNPTQSFTFSNVATTYSGNLTVFMEDEYDTITIKGEPPVCKYITLYNNVMILANTKNEVNRTADKTASIFWSDTGIGSTVETFPPFNTDEVGRSDEGEVTGIYALSDNVVIGKERQVYYMNGNLILQTYRFRSSLSNGVGCVSFRSMKEIEGGVLFMSSRGMYLAQYGRKPLELSDIIEPIFREFTSLELEKTKTINDIKNEKLLIHIPDVDGDAVLVWDYLFKEWFVHRNINASSGIQFLNEELYHADGTDLFLRSDEYNDNGIAIEAFYKSNWEDMGFPSVVKKWKKFVALNLRAVNWVLNLKVQHDWDVNTNYTDETIQLDGPVVEDQSIDNVGARKSMRIEIANSELNQGMLLTGYEFEYEMTQARPKGEH